MERSKTRPAVLIRDLAIFQLKLAIDGLKDIALIQLSLGAALLDLVLSPIARPRLFYRVLRMSERFDLWLNLYAAAELADTQRDGLFGASRAGSRTLLGRLEALVGGPEPDPLHTRA